MSYIDFLSRPRNKSDNQINLVEIEHGLIVTPTECRKIGWVPIFAFLKMPGKKWKTDLNFSEGGPNSELIKDY